MAKNSIADYSATAASNTDIQSVDIDEGCAPSGINNAIRELMADIAGELSPTADAQFAGVNYPAIAGIVESNANFIDTCLVGPAVDGKAWAGKFENGSVWSSLMLATVETSGANAEVNIWDLTAGALASASPLATVTLTGATPTSIAASMGYVIVGTSDQGVHFVDPHDGSWAERTDGWPRSLSSTTTPNVTDDYILSVCAGLSDASPNDPRTGGPLPEFGLVYGAGVDSASIIKSDGNVYDAVIPSGAIGAEGCAIANGVFFFAADEVGKNVLNSSPLISTIVADDWTVARRMRNDNYPFGFGVENAVDIQGSSVVAAAAEGLTLEVLGSIPLRDMLASINTTYTTGYYVGDIKLIALANSKTADRSYNANTLTENGTVTEAAVETGAELLGYSGFTANTNYLSRANDTDFEPGSGVAFVGLIWLKVNGVNDGSFDRVVEYQSTSPADGWSLDINNGGSLQSSFAEGGGSVSKASSATGFDDNAWHLAAFGRTTEGRAFISVDGLPREFSSSTDTDNMANASATLRIGEQVDGTNTLVNGTVALFRFAKASVSDDQIRKIYETEKGMFAANAKCLLQGASDAVLDARIDPLTGKYIVTQSDTQDIFDGLAIESERTIAAGGTTFEHGLLWGDGVAEINDANLYASMPATDQRQVNEMVRSMAAELPAGVDLSKAKAWVLVDQTSGAIEASFNVESISSPGTGRTKVTFAVPFKSAEYSSIVTADASQIGSVNNSNMKTGEAELYVVNDAGAGVNSTRVSAAFFGELENE